MKVIELIKLIKTKGVTVYTLVTVGNGTLQIEMKKACILAKLTSFDDKDFDVNITINKQGNVIIN